MKQKEWMVHIKHSYVESKFGFDDSEEAVGFMENAVERFTADELEEDKFEVWLTLEKEEK